MLPLKPMRVGYVVKRYPRYSETFIVNEILAHEAAGLEIEIFALRPPCDTHFQNIIARVRATVNYVHLPSVGRASESLNTLAPTAASYFWAELVEASKTIPNFWHSLEYARDESASNVYQAAWIAREVILKGITHLHAHFGSVATSVARLAAHFAGVPYTFTAHAKDIFHESVDRADLRRKLNDAAAVITVSDYNLNYLRENYGTAADRVERIYNGLNLENLAYKSPEVRPPQIISVGRLVEKKGLKYLIDACSILASRGCKFSCQIIGTGDCEIALQERIVRLGLQNQVKIIGPRPQNEVFKLLQQAAVFAAPYIIAKDGNRDGLPTVLLEAMALGTPCVGTDVTGMPEVISDRTTGSIVRQNDPVTLANALEEILQDPNLRVQLATRARQLVESEFDIDKNTARMRSSFAAIDRESSKQPISGEKESILQL